MDTRTPPTNADLVELLDRVAHAERRYELLAAQPASDADDAAALKDAFGAIGRLADRYRALFAALQPRLVDADAGLTTTVGITVGGLDIHVRDEGIGARLVVSVNDDEAPADRTTVIESWDGISWEQPLHENAHGSDDDR